MKRFHERYRWPLGLAMLLLVVEILFPAAKHAHKRPEKPGQLAAARAALFCVVLGMVFPLQVAASSGSALRDYKTGDYDKALQEYNKLLERKPSDPKLHFNAGAAAYKDKQYDQAVKHFGEATGAQDLGLQEQAYYNRGNSMFHLGEAIPDPNKKNETWQYSLGDFVSALKLNPKDGDAAHNRDFVKRKIEELKQQQQQQQKNDQKNEQKKDQDKNEQNKQQQQQQQKDQDKQNQQQNQEQQKQNQQNPQQDQSQQGQDKKEQGKSPEKQQDQQQPQEQKKSGDKKSDSKEKQEESDEQQGTPEQAVPGQMTAAQARQLLDAEKGDEKLLQMQPKENAGRSRPLRDW